MEEPKPIRRRESSEALRRRIAYSFANRTNTFKKFEKTEEERSKLKQVQSEHKQALKIHYGRDYNRNRIHNLPQFVYQISANT